MRLSRPYRSALLTAISIALCANSHAEEDVVFQAMSDEMDRTMDSLQLEDSQKPYFVSYKVTDSKSVAVQASLGGIESRFSGENRVLHVDVRVGDYENDNTNFFSTKRGPGFTRGGVFSAFLGQFLPVSDDYQAIRRGLWRATDREYKNAVSSFADKSAYLRDRSRTDAPPNLLRVEPLVHIDSSTISESDESRTAQVALTLSAVFKGHPHIIFSRVGVQEAQSTTRFLNSEGSKYLLPSKSISISALAATQASDGTEINDSFVDQFSTWDELPSLDEQISRIEALLDRLEKLGVAESISRYAGPVLFEGEAAAELLNQVLAPRIVGFQMPVVDDPRLESMLMETGRNPYEDRIGKAVLPEWLSVTDDPTRDNYEGRPLKGTRAIDAEGVTPQLTEIVAGGVLKTLLTTRTPPSGISSSSGSSTPGGFAAPSNLFVVPAANTGSSDIRSEFMKLVSDGGYDFGIVVKRLYDTRPRQSVLRGATVPQGGGMGSASMLEPALEAYKAYPDGREVLVQKALFADFNQKDLEDIVAASTELYQLDTFFAASRVASSLGIPLPTTLIPMISVIAPSLLFEDITIRPQFGNVPRLPVIPHPLLDN